MIVCHIKCFRMILMKCLSVPTFYNRSCHLFAIHDRFGDYMHFVVDYSYNDTEEACLMGQVFVDYSRRSAGQSSFWLYLCVDCRVEWVVG